MPVIRILIVVPRMRAPLGRWAEFLQGASDRKGWQVRILSGDVRGSGFADQDILGPRWWPWALRIRRRFFPWLRQAYPDRFPDLVVWLGQNKPPVGTDFNSPYLWLWSRSPGESLATPKSFSLWHKAREVSSGTLAGWHEDDVAAPCGAGTLGKGALGEWLARFFSPPPRTETVSCQPWTAAADGEPPCLDLRVGAETNLCHWLQIALGRILAAREEGWLGGKILIPPLQEEFQRTSLAWLGIGPENWIHAPTGGPLWSPALPSREKTFEILRTIFLPRAEAAGNGQRIYLSRRDAQFRRVSNEAALESELRKRGFSTVTGQSMGLAEKVACFREARLIVAPHGALLTFLAFCQPRAVIVELMPGHAERNCFREMAEHFGLRHFRLSCPTRGMQTGRQREADLECPVEDLLRFLDRQEVADQGFEPGHDGIR